LGPVNVDEIQARLDEFAKERDWEQFHSPKNLSMALAGEAGELLEVFQWLTEEQSRKSSLTAEQLAAATDELADVLIYALRLADRLDIDLQEAISTKINRNALRYTVDASRGNAAKR
jgi:NTP pyrophosphatase (non-canonical NTP hydrolase)